MSTKYRRTSISGAIWIFIKRIMFVHFVSNDVKSAVICVKEIGTPENLTRYEIEEKWR